MQTIKFKKKGILYYLHKITFKTDSGDTCTYKGQLILSFIIAIVTIHATLLRGLFHLIPAIRKDGKDYTGIKTQILFTVVVVVSGIVGQTFIEKGFIINDFIHWHLIDSLFMFYIYITITIFIGLLVVALVLLIIVIVIGIGYLIYKGISWVLRKIRNITPSVTNDFGEPTTQIGILYVSTKEKWCKLITWE